MEIAHRIEDNISILSLKGDLTAEGVDRLQETVHPFVSDPMIRGILLNFENVGSISSSGVSLLISIYRDLEPREANLVVCHLNRRHNSLFYTMGLDKVMRILVTEEDALKSFDVI